MVDRYTHACQVKMQDFREYLFQKKSTDKVVLEVSHSLKVFSTSRMAWIWGLACFVLKERQTMTDEHD